MRGRYWTALVSIAMGALPLAVVNGAPPQAQQAPPATSTNNHPAPPVQHITLEEAKQRALKNSKLLTLAALNVRGKEFATKAVRADYFPKILGTALYFHFNDGLGDVVTLGRHLSLPHGVPLPSISPKAVDVDVFNQNSYLSTWYAAQPITALLKVRQGVVIGRADEHIAQAQWEAGARALASGVEQLYWGLVAAQRIKAGAQEAVAGGEQLAKLGTVEARTALVEARQALLTVNDQIADLQEQLNALLDQPACTKLEVEEPPFPLPPVTCGDDAASIAVAASPDVKEAAENVVKAHAAVKAAKVDYLPNVVVMGGYANQTVMDSVQQNIGYIGVMGNWNLFEWGKRKYVVRERDNLVAMASQKLQQTEDEVRQKALKAFREFQDDREALVLAEEKAKLKKEAQAQVEQPAEKFAAAKASMEAQVDAVKADLAYRIAYVKLMALLGKQ
jgi:outer membrane protein TolC